MLKSGGWLRHYEILEPLGEGGMGEVFRARDSRLARDVAVKVLPERFKLDRYRMARFDREARVLASLNHPNIAAVHAIEECGDAYALVMELVEGETLAQRISRGSIPWRDAIHIAEQIAAGLEGAHELGVVHRDVKPANVCIRQDGAVKLLDFGLVKAVESPAVSAASVVTATADELAAGQKIGMGTPSYMSPEQARGLPVDKRTDIWAFGCVLYEMLTGKRAFAGDDAAGTIARVIEREPDFGALPSATPESIHRLLKRCLMKDRQHRLRDIGDAYLELGEVSRNLLGAPDPRKPHFSAPYLAAVAVTVAVAGVVWWFMLRSDSGVPGVNGPAAELSVSARAVGDTSVRGAGRATDGVKIANALPNSIAVLPFDNLSPDPADAYFAVGIHEELLNQLTKLGELHVVSRTSVQGYRDTNKPTPAIARELGVETVLDGSVRYADGHVVVTAHLSDGVTNASLWSDSYEREFSHIFAIQSDIALKVAQALKAELLPAERERIARAPTTSLQAYELYLSATTRQTRDTPEETALAIAEVEQALSLDPNFALAWVLNANLRTVAQFYDPANAAEHQRVGEQSARRALEIDPNLGDAHGALGFALFLMKDWVGGEAAFRNAVELNVPVGNLPSYAVLQLGVANFAYARDILQEHRSTLPQNPIALRFLMMANALLGDWPAAEAGYAFGMRVFAPWRQSENHMMHLRVGRNELDEARAISPEGPVNAAMIANLEHPQSALEALHETYRDPSAAGSPNTRRDIALWAAYFGDARLAVDAMRSAVTEQVGQAMYIWLPQFAHVRQLPEFRTLLRDIGIVAYWEQFGWPTICRPRGGGDFECS